MNCRTWEELKIKIQAQKSARVYEEGNKIKKTYKATVRLIMT